METIRGDLSTVTNGTMEVSYLCKGISRKLLNLLIYALFFIFGSFNKIVLISCDWQDQRSRRFFCTPFKLMFSPRFVRIKPIFFTCRQYWRRSTSKSSSLTATSTSRFEKSNISPCQLPTTGQLWSKLHIFTTSLFVCLPKTKTTLWYDFVASLNVVKRFSFAVRDDERAFHVGDHRMPVVGLCALHGLRRHPPL